MCIVRPFYHRIHIFSSTHLTSRCVRDVVICLWCFSSCADLSLLLYLIPCPYREFVQTKVTASTLHLSLTTRYSLHLIATLSRFSSSTCTFHTSIASFQAPTRSHAPFRCVLGTKANPTYRRCIVYMPNNRHTWNSPSRASTPCLGGPFVFGACFVGLSGKYSNSLSQCRFASLSCAARIRCFCTSRSAGQGVETGIMGS
jgi:hypothetical protein